MDECEKRINVIKRKILEENERRRKLDQQQASTPVKQKLKVKRSGAKSKTGDEPDAKVAELMEKMMRASAADAPKIAEQIQKELRKHDLKKNMKKNEEESMKRWEEEADQWRKQQEEEAKQAKKSAEAVSVKPKETGVKPVKKDKLNTKKDRTKQTPDDMLKELIKKEISPRLKMNQ